MSPHRTTSVALALPRVEEPTAYDTELGPIALGVGTSAQKAPSDFASNSLRFAASSSSAPGPNGVDDVPQADSTRNPLGRPHSVGADGRSVRVRQHLNNKGETHA